MSQRHSPRLCHCSCTHKFIKGLLSGIAVVAVTVGILSSSQARPLRGQWSNTIVTGSAVVVRELADGRLLVFGAIENGHLCRDALTRWLMQKTREHLLPRLEQLSSRTGLRYKANVCKTTENLLG